VFYTFIAQLKRFIDIATPTPTHRFIKTLDAKKNLRLSYTQSMDGLEAQVGHLETVCQATKSNGKGKSRPRTKDVHSVQLHGNIHCVRRIPARGPENHTRLSSLTKLRPQANYVSSIESNRLGQSVST
jgi:NAD-dependent SIR2 family protein deacetylase